MNNMMMPSQITWHLAWSDLFLLLRNLHTAICVKDRLQRVLFAGDNTVVCQNFQRVWLQFVEEFAIEHGYLAEVDLVPVGTTIATQLHYTNLLNFGNTSPHDIDQLIRIPVESPLLLSGVAAGVLMVSKNFCVWLQIQPDLSGEGDIARTSATNALTNPPWHLCARWQVTLVLDPQLISQVFKEVGVNAIAPILSDPATLTTQWQDAVQSFWIAFLQMTQHSNPSPQSQVPPSPPPSLLQPLLQQMPLGVFQASLDGSFLAVNSAFCQLTGYNPTQLLRLDLQSITVPDDFRTELELIQQVVLHQEQRIFEKRYCRLDGSMVWAEVKLSLVGHPEDENSFLIGFVTDLSDRRQIEAERLHAIQEIQQRQQRETLLNNITVRIRSALDLPTMLQNAAAELKQALRADRVVIYQILADGGGQCVCESVSPTFPVMQGEKFGADCIPPPYLDAYRTGRIWSVDDVSQAALAPCHQQMLAQVQVQSMIATGILSMDESLKPDQRRLWGLLVVHQCETRRVWSRADLHLVEAVASQLAIAQEQTKLLNRLTHYTHELEDRVRQRTYSLERSLKFEQFIRSLTECLHRGFDENHLFQTLVQGLVTTLNVDACLVSLYNSQADALEVKFEAFSDRLLSPISCLGQQIALNKLPLPSPPQSPTNEQYYCNGPLQETDFLLTVAQALHINSMDSSTPVMSQVVRPIIGVGQPLGMVMVVQFATREFDAPEMELVEQTTNYCAIALRQAHLYRQEHEQRLSAEYLRSFLEKSIDVYVEYDAQLRYLSINPAGCLLLARPFQEIIGKTNQELLPEGAHALEQLLRQAFTTAEKVFVDHEIVLPQGVHVFESVFAPITDPTGMVQRVIGVCRDITEFKQQWQQLESQNHQLAETTRLKQEFVATTSHELRTPLTAILGFSNVLLQEFAGQLNCRQKDYIERIYASGQHLLELINDILDLSRLEAGRMELDRQLIYIVDICEAVTSLLQERATAQGLNLEIDLDPAAEWMIADPRRLKQMLLNLLVNAIKFTPHGAVGLKVYCDTERFPRSLTRYYSTPNRLPASPTTETFIHFLVWDTGIGIAEADQHLLFAPFSQIDSSLARKHQGSGLGLVITQKLAELHGGWISLKSVPNQGSQFTVSLPLQVSLNR